MTADELKRAEKLCETIANDSTPAASSRFVVEAYAMLLKLVAEVVAEVEHCQAVAMGAEARCEKYRVEVERLEGDVAHKQKMLVKRAETIRHLLDRNL